VAENGAIGKDNRLLWRIAEDMAYFKQITWGHTVVMGRKTFESIGRPLPHRTNIVLSRTMAPSEQVQVAPDLPTALSMRPAGDEVFVIGGGRVYREALPLAHRLYLTEVHAPYDGDTFFPAVDFREWRETSRQDFPRGERFADGFSFVVYERNKS
jgi:dihydrofolate reductase